MGDILAGTTFSAGQLVTPDSLNKLVGEADLKDGVVVAGNLSDDVITNIIKGQESISLDELSSEDWLLIWDESEGKFKKVQKSDIGGVILSEGIDLSEVTADSAIDLKGNTVANILFDSDTIKILGDGSILMGDEKPILFNSAVGIQFSAERNRLEIYPVLSSNGSLAMTFNSVNVIARQDSTSAMLTLSGKDSGGELNNWFLISSHNNPELTISPSNDMTDRDTEDPDYQEPRVVIRGDLYIQDFDDIKTLPIQTDSTKSKLFVDELYNTSGESLIADGKVAFPINPSGGLELTDQGLQVATSAEALLVRLRIHQDDGVDYVEGTTHADRSSTDSSELSQKFTSMTDCYLWISNNIASTRIAIQIIHETDSVEPNYGQTAIRTLSNNLGKVDHISGDLYQVYIDATQATRMPENASLPKVFFQASNAESYANRTVLWFEHEVTFQGIELVCNIGSSQDHFSVIRIRKNSCLFSHTKLKVGGSQIINSIIDVVDYGSVRFSGTGFHQNLTGHEDIDDPYRNGGADFAPSFEFDGTLLLQGSVHFAKIGNFAKLEVTEYRPTQAGATAKHSRIHFSGNGTMKFTNAIFAVRKFSNVDLNCGFSVGTDLTFNLDSTNSTAFYAVQYNAITIANASGIGFAVIPSVGGFMTSNEAGPDYNINVDFGTDSGTGPVATSEKSEMVVIPDYF